MVKIVYVITQLGVGGAENVLVSMANKMQKLGHEVYVISLLNIFEQKFDDGISVFILDFKSSPFIAFVKLCKLISGIKPDVVHSHCIHANIITRLTKFFISIKRLVSTAHNTYEGTGLLMLAFKYTNFLSDVITNVSTDAVNAFEKEKYVKKNEMKVMFNIIDINKYLFSINDRDIYRKKFNINKGQIILITIARFKDSKDFPNLIRAISYIKNNYNPEFKFFIIGDGELFTQIKDMAKEMQVIDNIEFLGRRDDIRALLSMSDFFILASKHEGLPTVLIEAAMAKNYIISTDCGGVNDILPTTDNIVPIQDHITLAKRIIFRMKEDQDVRAKCVETTQNYIYNKFNPDIIVNQWIELYCK